MLTSPSTLIQAISLFIPNTPLQLEYLSVLLACASLYNFQSCSHCALAIDSAVATTIRRTQKQNHLMKNIEDTLTQLARKVAALF